MNYTKWIEIIHCEAGLHPGYDWYLNMRQLALPLASVVALTKVYQKGGWRPRR